MEQVPTLEQKLHDIALKTVANLELICRPLPELSTYDMKVADSFKSFFIALACRQDTRFDSVKANVIHSLSDRNRFKLKRSVDFVDRFTLQLYPSEALESATLYRKVYVPKEQTIREKWISGLCLSTEEENIFYNASKLDTYYVPLKTVVPVDGVFRFFNSPIPMLALKSTELSIEVTFGNQMSLLNSEESCKRLLLVESTMFDTRKRPIIDGYDPIV